MVALVELPGGTAKPVQLGSGVVWDQRGNIVTNAHVAARLLATPPVALFADITDPTRDAESDGTPPVLRFRTRLVGAAPEHDLAVVSVETENYEYLDPIVLGTSADLRVGQACFALGSEALSYGVVSGVNRAVQTAAGSVIRGAVQTDADVGAATSGGALMDSSGRMVGVQLYLPGR